ncbi:prolyl oligopeptidase family serine peptidase [Lewinella sp. IMCC34183]|uniref:S9 family peptidase n=1 Tax=Lewinella sp. IMCC34183 TaxID=2248762 RepID=UPI000E257D49|nr:prolyl oligopeptidase family serine peptidase [Lewinella sp. IMCC34183]
MRYPILFCLALLLCTRVTAQKAISVADMQAWMEIEREQLSADGSHVLYTLTPDVGDPVAVVRSVADGSERRFPRLHGATLTYDGNYLVGTLKPSRDTVLHYKRAEKGDELKKRDTLLVWDLNSPAPTYYPEVYDVKLSERSSQVFAYTTASLLPDSLRKDLDKDARRLVVRRFTKPDSFYLEGVMEFRVARDAPIVVARRTAKDSTWSDGIFRVDPNQLEWQTLSEGPAHFAGLNVSYDGDHVAFLSSEKSKKEEKQPPFHLHYWSAGSDSAYMVTGRDMAWLPRGYRISDDRRPEFSADGKYLFFGTTPRRPELDSNDIASELADVEVWTTEDPLLYTQQNNQLAQDRKFTYLAVYRTGVDKFQQLATPEYPETSRPAEGRGHYVLLYTDTPYSKETMWTGGPAARDAVVVDLENGRRTPVATAEPGFFQWSPEGKYVSWYNPVDSLYRAFSVASGEVNDLTSNELGTFYDELNDRPMDPYPYGVAGWTENDDALVIYDRYDLWLLDPDGGQAERLTRGREDSTSYRYYDLNPEREALEETLLLGLQRDSDYYGGYARLDADGELEVLATGPYTYGNFRKARTADRYLFTRESYADFPNLRVTDALGQPGEVISDANPQQGDFAWGSIEEYRWIDHEGRELRGLLVKPAGFDSTKQYPMMVNFYERSSEGVFRHRTPVPGRSSINYPHYASHGYVIFNPDVIYREGYPGESAYNCVMSGISALLMEGFVDKDRIGLQGHSWGGYQAAYLATKTDLFAAIEAGAPVVNMFSAYGGIRWGSGASRQFQYERTQSRIGGTIWDYPLRYLENSPLFFTDKVNTPVLILHNDEDGAVPWYQGIEWFTALRRLGKPAWFLNYRGEPHWPVKAPNRADFQTRMSQFFDYYLLDAPMPKWMKEGVSPLERGIEQNLEPARE